MNHELPVLPADIASLTGSAERVDTTPGLRRLLPARTLGPSAAVGCGAELRGASGNGRHVLFVAWRDLANPSAGGSEILVDRLAAGIAARGNRVTLLCGRSVGERRYPVRRNSRYVNPLLP